MGFALHKRQGRDIALTGRTSGIDGLAFDVVQFGTRTWGMIRAVRGVRRSSGWVVARWINYLDNLNKDKHASALARTLELNLTVPFDLVFDL
jgi:hypothetical protein